MNILTAISRGLLKKSVKLSTCRNIRFTSVIADNGYWLETQATGEEREQFYVLGAESYQHGTTGNRLIRDTEKQREFISAHFRYKYEKKLEEGSAGLVIAKKWEVVNGQKQTEPIYYGVCLYDTTAELSDPSEMLSIDKDAAETVFRDSEWDQENCHTPIREIAEDAGTEAWYLAHHIAVQKYKGQRVGERVYNERLNTAYNFGLKRHAAQSKENFKMAPFFYCLVVNTQHFALKFIENKGFEMVAHYHYNYKPGLGCYLDQNPGVENACALLYAQKEVAPFLRKKLKNQMTRD